MKIRPLEDRVLVRRDTEGADPRERGGIIVPDRYRWDGITGTVVAVGPGVFGRYVRQKDRTYKLIHGRFRRIDLRPGDRVLVQKDVGHEVDVDGVPHVMVREADVMGFAGDQERAA